MAWALQITPLLESRGMYLCVFILRHYRDQRPSGITVQRHAELLNSNQSSLRLKTHIHKCTGLWIRRKFPSTLFKYAVHYFCNTLSPYILSQYIISL